MAAQTIEYVSGDRVYDALPARPADRAPVTPVPATHTVFDDGGCVAGYATAGWAWDECGRLLGSPVALRTAVGMVADRDRVRRTA